MMPMKMKWDLFTVLAVLAALVAPTGAFTAPAARRVVSMARRPAGRAQCAMQAVPAGGKVLVVGNGPVMLLCAKRAALEGYDVTVVAGTAFDLYNDLLYDEPFKGEKLDNLNLLESITGTNEAAFDAFLEKCDGVLVAIDGEDTLSGGLVDVVLPAATKTVKRVVCMTRSLNGQGMGPFVSASKAAANAEVWSGSKDSIEKYRAFEAKIKARCDQIGAEYAFCRTGTLKGGGPGGEDAAESGTGKFGLSRLFYSLGQQDIVNFRLLFDCATQGAELTAGDVNPGPGLRAVFTATASDVQPGDSGRIAVAGAMVHALGTPKGNLDFGVKTAESPESPSNEEWAAMFAKL